MDFFEIKNGILYTVKIDEMQTTLNNNKAILLKTLYTVNPSALLKCFEKNIKKVDTY